MIFQNVKFIFPSGDQRETPELASVMDEARQALLEDTKSPSSADAVDILLDRAIGWSRDNGLQSRSSWRIQNTYAFHPGMQLRLKMNGLQNGDESNYYRYTNYETAEIGSVWTDKYGEWERKSFTSREDNVTISRIYSLNNGTKLSLELSIDDISDMSNENKMSGRLSDMRYKKFYKQNGSELVIGEVVHYPSNEHSELKNGGYAGLSRIIVKGDGAETAVEPGAVPEDDRTEEQKNGGVPDETVINVSGSSAAGDDGYIFDYDPVVHIENADEVIIITASDTDDEMGGYEEFAGASGYALVSRLSERTAAAAERYGGNGFDYDAALAPHAQKHYEQFGAVTLDLNADEDDRALPNEELIKKQQSQKSGLNLAMLKRAFYNGRYANVFASGYQSPRLGGIWTGAFEVQWSGDYTTDANINLQVAGNNIGSMPAASEGFINLILRIVTDWEINAKQVYGIDDALLCPTRTDGSRSPIIHFDDSFPGHIWNAGASWMLLPVYEYLLCYGDRQIPLADDIREMLSETGNTYNMAGISGDGADDGTVYNLRNTLELTDERVGEILSSGYLDLRRDILYPLLKKTANFWTGLLTPEYYTENGEAKYEAGKTELEEGQYYLITPGYSPENTPLNSAQTMNMNSVMDISAARDCFNMAAAVAESCGDGSETAKWREYESKLPPYLYELTGELKEWALSCYEENYEHRHTSQLYGLWPGYEGETDKTLFEGAKKLIETKNAVLPSTASDNVAGHGWVHKGLISARAKSADGVREALLAVLTNEMYYSSMMTSHDTTGRQSYCTDTAITVPAILLESMVYSDRDVIELAPALTDELLEAGGNVSGLRSRTGDEIAGIGWSKDKITAQLDTDGEIRLKCAMPFKSVFINGEDKTGELMTDDTGDSYITVSGNVEAEFVLTDVEAGTYSLQNSGGLLLTADGVSEGAAVGFTETELSDNALWSEQTVNGAYTAFKNKLYADEYIDIQDQKGRDGTQLCSWNEDPAASSNRQFRIEEKDGYIYIWTTSHEQGNYRWEADDDKVFEDSSGRLVYNTFDESNDAQKWVRVSVGDCFAYKNVGTERFIELAGPDPGEQMTTTSAGQPFVQLWNIEYLRGDMFRLINLASGKALDYEGENLTVKNGNGGSTQLWRYADGILRNEAGYTLSNEITLARHGSLSPTVTADSVTISLPVTELKEGEQARLDIVTSPTAAAATGFDWDISGSGSVDISDNGTITALRAGTVDITAAAKVSGAVSNTVTLTVTGAIGGYSLISDYEIFGRTDGKWETASPPENAFDGNAATVYDGQAGGYCGMIFDEPQQIAAIRYQSGDGYEDRMPGCEFQVSQNGEEYVTIFTIESVKPNGEWNYILSEDFDAEIRNMLENNAYKYFRFYGAEFAPIAELSVYTKAEEEPGTDPDTDGFVTVDEDTGEIIYDIAGFAGSLGLSEDTPVTEGVYEELEGLTFHNGEQPLYWVAKHPRVDLYPGGYIAYTAPENGTLSVMGASNKSDPERYISIVDDPSEPMSNVVINGTETETKTGSAAVMEGKTYYIMGLAAQVTAVIFTPNEDSVTYRVNAAVGSDTIAVLDEGILNADIPQRSVCVPRFVKGEDGAWYELSGAPDPFDPDEFSYEVTVTTDSPILDVAYTKSEDTVYFAEAEALFNDTYNTWTGYSGGGFAKASGSEAQTDIIPAGTYSVTIGYKGGRSAGFAQPKLLSGDEVILSGDLGVKVTGESSCIAILDEDTALTVNSGDGNNELDYIHIRKADKTVAKYSEAKAADKLSFKDGELIGFIGDSITHGDEGFESYHEVLYNYLMTHYPDTKLYMKNLGVSSSTGKLLLSGANGYSAIDTYLSENPEMSKAFVMLGMNDIDRDLYEKDVYESTAAERAAALEEYEASLNAITDKLLDKNIEVILMSPTIYDATRNGSDGNLSNEGLKECANIVKAIAAEKGCRYIELNAPMLEINDTVQSVNPNLTILDAWYDNFHPGAFGNNIMGYLILRQLGEGDDNIILSSGGGENSEISDETVLGNYVSYEYTLSKLPMTKTDGYAMADKYVNLTEELGGMFVKEELDDGVYELSIDGTVLGSYSADELRQGVNIAFSSANPACIAAEAAQALNIERSRYEISLQRAVMWLVFNRYIDESEYNDIISHKDEYLSAVKAKTDEMYDIVNAELSVTHRLEIKPENGSVDTTKTALTVTDTDGSELTGAADAVAAGRINVTVSISADDTADGLVLYAAQYGDDGALLSIDMLDHTKDGDTINTDVSPDCKKLSLLLWDEEQRPVINALELK